MFPVLLFDALIVDAAVETFWRGSPVRWTAVAIAVSYAVARLASWRRSTPRTALAIWTIAFAGMVAITAWQPGGLENGVRLLGLSTSTVLLLAVAFGVGVGTVVLSTEARLPRAMRWLAAVLGACGVIALAQGILGGVPVRALLTGASFWRPLPSLLQGALVGAVLVTAVSFVVTIVRTGVRAPREGSGLRAIYEIAASATALSVTVAALPLRSAPAPRGSVRAGDFIDADPSARLAQLDNSLRAIEDGERESPRDRWDPDYVVQQLGRDPRRIFEWVRDNTFWIPYRGVLRGPIGVLMDREGNSLDRALLLATLLEKAGHTVRLAHGDLTPDRVRDLLPALVAQRAQTPHTATIDGEPVADDQPSLRAAAAQYHLNAADVERSLSSGAMAVSKLSVELRARVAEQSRRLLGAVGIPKLVPQLKQRFDTAVDACRDHWWVQRRDGERWIDLDLLSPDPAANAALTTPDRDSSVSGLDASLQHELVVRVMAEHWSRGVLKDEAILAHTVRPSELIGDTLALQFWPSSWPAELDPNPNARFGFRAAALEQTDWTAALVLNRNVLARGALRATGAVRPAAGDTIAGLGRSIVNNRRGSDPPDSESLPQLTAVWIEYEFRAPGDSPRTVRRVLFDLLGPSLRAAGVPEQFHLTEAKRLTRSLSLMMRTEMLPLAAKLAPEFGVHLSARSVLAHRELLQAIARPDVSPESPRMKELMANAAPGVSALFAIAVGRFAFGSPAVFVDRLNLITRHQYPAARSDGIHFIDAVDIVSNEVGVDLTQVDGFAARVAQGVLDTNVETLLHVSPWRVSNTAEAFNASRDWTTIGPTNRGGIEDLQVSADVRHRITADLDSGLAVVAPQSDRRANDLESTGWWRIDPVTGDTLGVGANGWGQALAEDFVRYVAVRYAKDFAFQYAFCQAVPQVANQVVMLLEQYRDQLPPWLPPLAKGKDPGAVFQESHKGCLIGAMIGTGVTAALPLLIATLRFSAGGWVGASPAKPGANPFAKTLPEFKTQPSVNPLAKTEAGVNPLAKTEPGINPLAQTEPGPSASTAGPSGPAAQAGPSAGPGTSPLGPPRGSPPPGEIAPSGRGEAAASSPEPQRGMPRPSTIGAAPPGDGPFQGDPELRDYLENNPDHPLTQSLAGNSGDAAALYRQADGAATSAYNAARNAGLNNDAARQASYEAYWNYLKQGRGDYYRPLPPGSPKPFEKVNGPGTFKIQVGAAGLGGSGPKP